MKEKPYLFKKVIIKERYYNPKFGDNKLCTCGFEFVSKDVGFKYECPECKGKFNVVGYNGQSHYCPFCGKDMKGL